MNKDTHLRADMVMGSTTAVPNLAAQEKMKREERAELGIPRFFSDDELVELRYLVDGQLRNIRSSFGIQPTHGQDVQEPTQRRIIR